MMNMYNTCPEYEEMKRQTMRGWKTWNVYNVFSFVHMPDGLSVNICFKEYRNGCFLEEALIGRFPTEDWEDATEVLHPLEHAADDSYAATWRKNPYVFLSPSGRSTAMYMRTITR